MGREGKGQEGKGREGEGLGREGKGQDEEGGVGRVRDGMGRKVIMSWEDG